MAALPVPGSLAGPDRPPLPGGFRARRQDRPRGRSRTRPVAVQVRRQRDEHLRRRCERDGAPAPFRRAVAGQKPPGDPEVPGVRVRRAFAGTNGIGLALAERQLIRVHGAEHFAERSQGGACRALPVRDPLSGRIEGVLCLGYPRSAEDPSLATVIRKAAEAIERRLLGQSSARERALLQAYLDTGAEAADGLHRGVGVDEPALGLRPRDRTILKEKAAELISLAQRAAVEVALPDGRRVTLVSRPMTSACGVEGIAIEAVLPGPSPRAPLVIPRQADGPQGFPAEPATPLPSLLPSRCRPCCRPCRPCCRPSRPAARGRSRRPAARQLSRRRSRPGRRGHGYGRGR